MGAFCCHGNHSFWSNMPQNLMQPFLHPVMQYIKFDQYWSTGFRDIQVWKCGRRRRRTTTDDGRRRTTTDGRRTIGILQAHLVSLRLRRAKNQSSCSLFFRIKKNGKIQFPPFVNLLTPMGLSVYLLCKLLTVSCLKKTGSAKSSIEGLKVIQRFNQHKAS